MKEKDKIYDLILKELSSKNSTEEKEHLNEELSNNSGLSRRFYILKEFWTKFFPKKQNHDIIAKTEKKLGFTYGPGSKIKNNHFLKIAAIIVFMLSFGFSSYQILKPKQELILNEYACGPGEIKEITLSDGTRVWLNSMSLLIASEPFLGNTREVKLFGEAYFEVAHNQEQPFIVQTRQLKTRVLGTHFDVVAYPTDEVHEIALHEGSVNLEAENDNLKLKPGDRAYFSSSTGRIRVVNTDLGKPAKWRDGILRFYDEDLFSITKKLERKFHTRILITDSIIGNLKYTAEFQDESLDDILKLLKEAHSFNYTKTENGIIIQKQT